MPQLDDLIAQAQKKETKKKIFSRGNRPDRIATGQAQLPGEVKGTEIPQETETEVEPKLSQTEAKVEPTPDLSILVGLQEKILREVYFECRRCGSKISGPIAISILAKAAETTVSAARKAIQRLEQKQFLFRKEFKDGRGGWTRYALYNLVYQQLLFSETRTKLEPKLSQTEAKVEPELRPELRPTLSSSSSNRSTNSEELLTTEDLNSTGEVDAGWREIDSTPLSEIRFGVSQIAQVARIGSVTPEQLQESIYAFAFDLSENQKAKNISGAPLNYFMGILRKGPYTPPVNYESSEDRQQRLYLEAKEEQRKRRREREAKLEAIEFEEWSENLSLEERSQIVPPRDFSKPGGTAHTMQLREYFRENIWPALRERSKGVTP